MADLLYLLLTLAAFGAFVLLVRGCAAIVGDEAVSTEVIAAEDRGDPR